MNEYTENFSTMTDVMLMTFLLQSNVVKSMTQLNVMAGTIEQPAPIPYPPDTKLASSPRSEEAQELQNRYKAAEAAQYPANQDDSGEQQKAAQKPAPRSPRQE